MKFRIVLTVFVGSLLVASPVMADKPDFPLLKHPVEIIKYCKEQAKPGGAWAGSFGACVASEIGELFPLPPLPPAEG
jgi:hypothetical protein